MSLTITLVSDNPNSWIIPYTKILATKLRQAGHRVRVAGKHMSVVRGDIAVFLGCERIVKPEVLQRNKHNLVVHESKLPAGRGWSPLTWQILENKNAIPITLFEAADEVDSGDIYLQDTMNFNGTELIDELRAVQGDKTIELVLRFVKSYPKISGSKQHGKPTYYQKRKPIDGELNPKKTIQSQFNLLRVVDNERYPAFFKLNGKKYIIKIYKDETYGK